MARAAHVGGIYLLSLSVSRTATGEVSTSKGVTGAPKCVIPSERNMSEPHWENEEVFKNKLLCLERVWNWNTCIFPAWSGRFPPLSWPRFLLQGGHVPFHVCWHCWAPGPAAPLPACFLVILPRSLQPSLLGVDAGENESLFRLPRLKPLWGLSVDSLKLCTPVLFTPSRGEPGHPGMATSSAAIPVCLWSMWDGERYLGLLSCCSCRTWRRKGNLQASDACLSGQPFPLRTPCVERRAGLVPMASSTTGTAGGYFCSGGVRGTRAQLPKAVLHMRLCRGSQVRLCGVSFKDRELSWCQPSPHTFIKSLPSSLPFQPLSFRPTDQEL